MKIEIGESLCLSYLKHVKKCVIYQTNWKNSSQWDKYNEEIVEKTFKILKAEESPFYRIFNHTSRSQLLKQAEIDALGIDQGKKIYAIDIAFHEAGLNYGGKEETTERLIKKYLRSYLILLSYFPNRDYEIIFASPKVNEATESSIKEDLKRMENMFCEKNVTFIYLSNEDFKKEILINTINKSKDDADTNELFIRAHRLLQLFHSSELPKKAKQVTKRNKVNLPENFIELVPADEKEFKQKLLNVKRAKRTWFYNDGREIQDVWTADNITEKSRLRNNILSNNKVKNRLETGLCKVRLEISEESV